MLRGPISRREYVMRLFPNTRGDAKDLTWTGRGGTPFQSEPAPRLQVPEPPVMRFERLHGCMHLQGQHHDMWVKPFWQPGLRPAVVNVDPFTEPTGHHCSHWIQDEPLPGAEDDHPTQIQVPCVHAKHDQQPGASSWRSAASDVPRSCTDWKQAAARLAMQLPPGKHRRLVQSRQGCGGYNGSLPQD